MRTASLLAMIATAALLLLLLAGCSQNEPTLCDGVNCSAAPGDPVVTTTGVLFLTPFQPPKEYVRWYKAMEECLGLKGDYAKLRWFVVPAPWKEPDAKANETTHGFWHDGYIVVNAKGWRDSVLVSHETVHDILSYQNLTDTISGHPAAFFRAGGCATRYLR